MRLPSNPIKLLGLLAFIYATQAGAQARIERHEGREVGANQVLVKFKESTTSDKLHAQAIRDTKTLTAMRSWGRCISAGCIPAPRMSRGC